MHKLIFIALVLILGCTTPYKVRKDTDSRSIFPTGKYHQSIVSEVNLKNKAKNFDFNAIINKGQKSFHLIGISGFGISLFKMSQLNDEPIMLETSIKEILQNEDFFKGIFRLTKEIFELQKDDARIRNNEIQIKMNNLTMNVHFSNYDQQSIPLNMIIKSQSHQIVIETMSYEL